ncbi:endoglucanase D precursor [bacterium BMS3Abin03]|nr:endoglucanase D precursor [bacterium BMS3Abin03]
MKILSFLLIIVITNTNYSQDSSQLFIRINQVGYLPGDIKSGVVFSDSEITYNNFNIVKSQNEEIVFHGNLIKSAYSYGRFNYCFTFDFTGVTDSGEYRAQVGNKFSFPFQIGNKVFNPVVDSLALFFKVQRCGPTQPLMHKKCHLSDATSITGFDSSFAYDVTGGWHDAGDYIKFFSTTALTTYMLLFSYEFDNVKFGFDNDKNNVPDILEEAKVGLDWLLRCNLSDTLFVAQVQDERDHNVGWRMPEDDTLTFDRPGFTGIGKNQIGIFSAVMALASKIWSDKFFDNDFANKYLTAAIQKYSVINKVADIDSVPGFYKENSYYGKLALGAIELYNATGITNYLNDAITFGDSAKTDFWWSWGDINSLAHYKISKVEPRFSAYILDNLKEFNSKKNKSLFNEAFDFKWGTTTSLMGIVLQAILYKNLAGSSNYDSLMIFERDYLLGRNPWGISFITGIGTAYPLHPHHQIAYFNNGRIPGAVVGGPANRSIFKDYDFEIADDRYALFNNDMVEYNDDRNDFISNEPTIFGNSTAIFVFGYFSERK